MADENQGQNPADVQAGMDLIFSVLIGIAGTLTVLILLSGQLSALLTGHGWPDLSYSDIPSIVAAVARHPGRPQDAWRVNGLGQAGPGWLIFLIFAGGVLAMIPPLAAGIRVGMGWRRRRTFRRFRLGFASPREIKQMLGTEAVLRKAGSVRPSLRDKRSVPLGEVSFSFGQDIRSRRKIYGSLEDVAIILAPPRQGKDVHFCAPFTIDAPGPCIVTSTRADAFSNTYSMRSKVGKVHVFDPNGLTNWPERLRWSPITGCENPLSASNRATSIVLGSGLRMEGSLAFYVGSAITVLRIYLHAAALGSRTMRDVIRWAEQPTNPEPITILRNAQLMGRGAEGWAAELEARVAAPTKERGAVWSTVMVGLSCFSDPALLNACSPDPEEVFDLAEFLSGRNTLYILGKEKKHGSVAPVITAMMEDLFDETRKIASQFPGSRLDPPLTVELNEAAHIAPLPSLPAYMGDSGGFSIALHVYLQSLSQARSRWGDHEAMIMWDNAAIRVVMGGAGNISDLEDISRLMGDVPPRRGVLDRVWADAGNGARRERVLSAEEVRTLKFGTAVVVARSARPVEVRLTPWWKRADGNEIAAGKSRTEKMIAQYTATSSPTPSAQAAD